MGLPVWSFEAPQPSLLKSDPTRPARSPIRRRPARAPRSPRLRDADAQATLSSSRPSRAYPPAPRVPTRTHTRREEHPLLTLPALTPNFAPAAHRRRGVTRAHVLRRPETRSPAPEGDAPAGADEDSSEDAVGFPPLRRMGRRTIADGPLPASSLRESWSPATTLDGLGDRERSMSPVVDDHWETMLTGVAPDPIAPTAESSFASAAASASFSTSHPSSRAGSSNSNSAASSRTHLTVPSRRQSWSNDNFLRACDTSEDDSASDTEAEEETISFSMLPPRRAPGVASNEPPPRDPRYSRAIRERSRESTSWVRSFYGEVPFEHARRMEAQLAAEERAATDEERTIDEELRDARTLLERLTRRDDISDDFWASVGLRRPVADRVERIQQRERL